MVTPSQINLTLCVRTEVFLLSRFAMQLTSLKDRQSIKVSNCVNLMDDLQSLDPLLF